MGKVLQRGLCIPLLFGFYEPCKHGFSFVFCLGFTAQLPCGEARLVRFNVIDTYDDTHAQAKADLENLGQWKDILNGEMATEKGQWFEWI